MPLSVNYAHHMYRHYTRDGFYLHEYSCAKWISHLYPYCLSKVQLTSAKSCQKDSQFNAVNAWWRHKMERFSALLALCAGNSPVNSSHKGQWRGAWYFYLICVWINREAGDLSHYRAHYDVTVMTYLHLTFLRLTSHTSQTNNYQRGR